MTRMSEFAENWFGLCRKPPEFRASQADIVFLPEPAQESSPDGGAGGPGTIRRGIGAALSGTKTLIHNPQLLWFALLIGLVLAVNSIAQCCFIVFPSSSDWRFFFNPDSVRLLTPLVLTFVAGFLTVFCFGFLLVSLVLSISSKKDSPVSFFQGLNRAKKYLIPLTAGSIVVALSGIQLFVHPFIVQGELFVRDSRWLLFVDPNSTHLLISLVQQFVIEFATLFCLVFLLAGLIMSISSKQGGPVLFFQGLYKAKKYSRPLTLWSVVVALAGSLLFIAGKYSFLLSRVIWQSLINLLNKFPFNFILNYQQLQAPFIASLPSGLWGGYSIAVGDTLILFAINVLLLILTLFVVPLIVLGRKSLKEAVVDSFILMKKIWGEVAACVLYLGIIVLAASFMFLVFQFSGVDQVWWEAGQMNTSYTNPSDAWIAAGLLYVLALSSLVLVVATIGGIASLNLYTSAKIRESAR